MEGGGNTVPGAGVEPARLAALVFETSASTDSAIRATFAHASLKNRARAPIDSPKTGTAKVEKTCDTAKSNHAGLSENTVSLQNMMSGQKKDYNFTAKWERRREELLKYGRESALQNSQGGKS